MSFPKVNQDFLDGVKETTRLRDEATQVLNDFMQENQALIGTYEALNTRVEIARVARAKFFEFARHTVCETCRKSEYRAKGHAFTSQEAIDLGFPPVQIEKVKQCPDCLAQINNKIRSIQAEIEKAKETETV